ncbi:diiron oxygenase [Streptomyces sp. NBC_01477]|uniref:diiron oxygenase n=1 Tax=Streptomyces sp. NBC_01477 TaxID=2976015 RepID=UPI002E326F48|nr:diiron oxygenase [Streptomyces sp. NBC_01477]
MCGVVGLFQGCPAVSFCPARLRPDRTDRAQDPDPDAGTSAPAPAPGAGDGGAAGEEPYRSPFRTWYERASVRQAPRRLVTAADGGVATFFPPALVPLASHRLVRDLGPAAYEQVLVQHLYRYLDFTAKLEYLVVNRTALGIAHGSVDLGLPREMRLDALKIYCDEAYHTLMTVDLLEQITDRTRIAPRLPEEPYFLRRLAAIQESTEPELRPLVELLFVIVSETLITGSLSAIPRDQELLPQIRDTIQDHASDEGRHHAYFALFARHLWGALDTRTRRWAALRLPGLIHTFLDPDLDSMREELLGYGMPKDSVEQVLAEVFTSAGVQAYARSSAETTVRHFAALGVLEDPEAREAFDRQGLLPPAGPARASSAPAPDPADPVTRRAP